MLGTVAPAAAQGFGIGGRLAWVTHDVDLEDDSVRFAGGQIRLGGGRLGIELAMDRHSETFEALDQKVVETPIQASLLLRLTSGNVSPYLLGGPGWYRRSVEPIDGPEDLRISTTDFGWHAGGGLELRFGRHVGLHGDYRYTFLDFGDDEDDDEDEGFIGGLLPGYKGSMWTLGMTVYF
jgi:opacity protein-like surface antigen